jgi:hypothetical protein
MNTIRPHLLYISLKNIFNFFIHHPDTCYQTVSISKLHNLIQATKLRTPCMSSVWSCSSWLNDKSQARFVHPTNRSPNEGHVSGVFSKLICFIQNSYFPNWCTNTIQTDQNIARSNQYLYHLFAFVIFILIWPAQTGLSILDKNFDSSLSQFFLRL